MREIKLKYLIHARFEILSDLTFFTDSCKLRNISRIVLNRINSQSCPSNESGQELVSDYIFNFERNDWQMIDFIIGETIHSILFEIKSNRYWYTLKINLKKKKARKRIMNSSIRLISPIYQENSVTLSHVIDSRLNKSKTELNRIWASPFFSLLLIGLFNPRWKKVSSHV